MNISKITIDGENGLVEIARTEYGAWVSIGDTVLGSMRRDDEPAARYATAQAVAKAIYGVDRRREANATNSMIHEVMNEIERVAGC